MDYYLGIDIGTGESKGVLIDSEGKICVTSVTSHCVNNPQPGWFSQDADVIWWGDFCKICHVAILNIDCLFVQMQIFLHF